MKYLKSNEFPAAFKVLEDTLHLLKEQQVPPTNPLWGVTLNNLGCYYKEIKKPVLALHYFERAVNTRARSEIDILNLAGVHLNIAFIKSLLHDPVTTITNTRQAVKLLTPLATSNPSACENLALAYRTQGKAYMQLNEGLKARKALSHGLSICERFIGACPLASAIAQDLLACKKNLTQTSVYHKHAQEAHISFSPVHRMRFLTGDRITPMGTKAKSPKRVKRRQRREFRKLPSYSSDESLADPAKHKELLPVPQRSKLDYYSHK